MDLRRRKPRRQRIDEDAGLVFAWRVPGGSLLRTFLAIALTAGLFAGAAVVVHVDPRPEQVRMQDSGGVTLLWTDDPAVRQLLSASDVDSPFPDRWELQSTDILRGELRDLGAELVTRSAYQPRLRPRIDQPQAPELPRLFGDAAVPLPAPTVQASPPPARPGPLKVYLRAVAQDGLEKRWRPMEVFWEGHKAESLLGREANYLVGVSPPGLVEFCLAIDTAGLDGDLDALLANWLRQATLPADPKQTATEWGVVRITFNARLDGEGDQP